MRIDQQLLMILLSEKEPVSAKKLAFSLGVSEKTVQKYTAQLKIILEGHGAQLITRQRVGSNIEITDQALFKQFMNRYNSNSFLDDPMTRKRYVLTRLITTDEYISIYDLSDEISSSPSLTRLIFKELNPVLDNYSLRLSNSHFNGYRIEGDEKDIRRCLARECKESEYIANTLAGTSISSSEKEVIHDIIAGTLEQFNISVSSESINSLTLHALLAINRIETNNPIELPNDLDLDRAKAKIEFVASREIIKKMARRLNIHLPENELYYFSMHISGQQRFLGHEQLQVTLTDSAMLFYNRFLRNIWKYADEDFFNDEELRTSLLNHIVPFQNRVNNDMQIEKSELNNIKSEFPYAYDLSVTGLSFLEDQGIHITEVEISYFALHLQLAIEKRKESENLKYNVLCICEKTSSVFHMLSYKINQHFQDRINEIVFAPVSEIKNYYLPDFHVVLCTADENNALPPNTIYISPYINENDINTIRTAFNHLSSKIMNNIVLKEYLFFDISADSREEVFQKGTNLIQQFIKLPDDFLERLESRENMASTEYDSRIAIPHPIDMSDIPEFISVFRLDKPVLWKTKQVQLIFLICNRGEISPIFYTKFSKIIRDSDLSQKLIQAEDFSKFSEIIESI